MHDLAVSTGKKYTRIVSRADGSSAFEDGEIDLADQVVAQGVPPMLVGALPATNGALYLQSSSFDSKPHPAPRTQWVIMLRARLRS
jgi:hypothetical protein